MHILVTGGTGLIGRHFIQTYASQYKFTVLTRNIDKAHGQLPKSVSLVDQLSTLDINDFDGVINLAGEPIADKRWSKAQKQRIYDSRLNTTRALVKAIKEAKSPPHFFVSGSAIGYYGRQDDTPVSEDMAHPHDEFTHQLCRDWENCAQEVADVTRVSVLRTGIVLSRNGGALAKMALPFKLGLGGRIGSGKQYMSWIHIDDMIRAIQFIIEHKEAEGEFNLTAPTPVNNANFTKTLGQVLGRPTVLPVPSLSLKLMLGEGADLLLTGQRVIPAKLIAHAFKFSYPDLTSALENIFHA